MKIIPGAVALVLLSSALMHGQYTVSTVAGGGPPGGTPATGIGIYGGHAIAVDNLGSLYIAPFYDGRVYKVDGSGNIAAVVGNGTRDFHPTTNGPSDTTQLGALTSVTVDGSGAIYIADMDTCRVRKVAGGTITTVAGNGVCGFSGDGGQAASAQLNAPQAIAVDSAGGLYIADAGNHRVRKVVNGVITTLAGTGTPGYNGDSIQSATAQLNDPEGVAVDSSFNVYIADTGNNRIRKVSGGLITTATGNGTGAFSGDGLSAGQAQVNSPQGVAVDTSGNVYIADTGNQRVRKIAIASGLINTVAGSGSAGFSGDGGLATSAQLSSPNALGVDPNGVLYIYDSFNFRVRKVVGTTINTAAGNGLPGYSGEGGPALNAQLSAPGAPAFDPNGTLYFSDFTNDAIRKLSSGNVITVAGNSIAGFGGDGGQATSASIFGVYAVAFDASGVMYFTDSQNNRVRKVSGGIISTIAGTGVAGFGGDNGPATNALLNTPWGIAVDSGGSVYFADNGNNRIRKIAPGGVITTITGSGSPGFSGDNGQAAAAQINFPTGLALDAGGNLFFCDLSNQRIRRISTTGIITTVAGTGVAGFSGDNGPATSAQLNNPLSIAFDSQGALYITDTTNGRVRVISPGGTISTIAGNGTYGFTGDGGAALQAEFSVLDGIAVDGSGNVYVGDGLNNRIRRLTPPSTTISTVPSGLSIVVDGATWTTPQSFTWLPGSSHSVTVTSPQTLSGTQYTFANWADGPVSNSRTITASATGATYTANFTSTFGQISTPTPGSNLTGSTVTFNWIPGTGADGYWLDVGTAPSVGDISGGPVGNVTSKQVTGLPRDGSTVYVSLYSHINGSYSSNGAYNVRSYTYTAMKIATLSSPPPGTTLGGSTVTFSWGAVPGAAGYWLDVGTAPFQGNISGGPLTATSKQVSGLPVDGSTVYVTLYTNINGSYSDSSGYLRNSYTYKSGNIAGIASPVPGSMLNGANVVFSWLPVVGATEYWLDVGTAPYVGNISGGSVGTNTSRLVTGLPVDGSTIYATLYTKMNGSYQDSTGAYLRNAYTYTALRAAAIAAPAPGTTFSSSAVSFSWAAVPGATEYWLDVGTAPYVGNISGGSVGANTSKLVTGIPEDGSTIYATLYTKLNGSYQDNNGGYIRNAYTYRALKVATITAPAPGSTLTSSSVLFSWVAIQGATEYWLDVGTSPYVGNISSGSVGASTSKQVTGLPVDGSTVYATLYTKINGSYQDSTGAYLRNSYSYSTMRVATITSPAPGSLLIAPSATFTWTSVPGATEYWLDVGTAPYVGNISSGSVGASTSKAVTGLPLNGGPIYATIYTKLNGSYQDASGGYLRNAYTYSTVSIGAIVSPTPGSILSSSTVTFSWSPYSGGATQYWLDVGTSPFVGDIFGGNVGSATSQQVTGLPIHSSTIYITLYTKINGSFQDGTGAYIRNSYTFLAPP